MITLFSIKTWSLRVRIFISMIIVTVISSILVTSLSLFQFQKENQDYHQERLQRKENQIKAHIVYILSKTPHPLITQNIPFIFKNKIFEIADIHNLEINLYNLQGRLILSSNSPILPGQISLNIPEDILEKLKYSDAKSFVTLTERAGDKYRFSYSYLMDYVEKKPIGIIKLPYKEDDSFYANEMKNFLSVFGLVYLIVMGISIFIAYYLSRFITKSLKIISDKLSETSLTQKNTKIELKSNSYEIDRLVESYNNMIDQLEESANKLAQNQREEAWQEMAKQVAHEIKNPLTPMRLTVQGFQQKFDPQDPNITAKINELSKILIQQIDIMGAVASAFSNFASMPAQQNETLNVVAIVKLALDIFNEEFIQFHSDYQEIITIIDRTQLIRIITNLVKNALQAIPEEQKHKSIVVSVSKETSFAIIKVKDNGSGIKPEDYAKIFEPKFTTKTSGMGLGLAIIKNSIENYHGTINFETKLGQGTTFTVALPITNL